MVPSKQVFSVMFCGGAAGDFFWLCIKPNIVMKGGHNVGLLEQFMTPLQVVGLMPVHLSGGFRTIF